MTVKQQQLLLEYIAIEDNDARYSPKGIDGVMGQNTKAALAHVKETYGVDASGLTGIIGKTVSKKKVIPKTENTASVNASANGLYGSKYFSRDEFRCKCGGRYCNGFPHEPSEKLVKLADTVREHFNAPATVSSGLRCEVHNRESGGVATSKHRLGTAMDFCIKGVSAAKLDAYIGTLAGVSFHYIIKDKNGNNTNYVHMDV